MPRNVSLELERPPTRGGQFVCRHFVGVTKLARCPPEFTNASHGSLAHGPRPDWGTFVSVPLPRGIRLRRLGKPFGEGLPLLYRTADWLSTDSRYIFRSRQTHLRFDWEGVKSGYFCSQDQKLRLFPKITDQVLFPYEGTISRVSLSFTPLDDQITRMFHVRLAARQDKVRRRFFGLKAAR